MIRIAFLIPSLVAHGAERQLCELVRGMDPARFEIHAFVFYGPGEHAGSHLWAEAEAMPGVRWHCLHKRRGLWGNLALLPRLLARLWKLRPDLLHGYMDGNLPALLAGRLLGRPVVWGIRRAGSTLHRIDGRSRRLLKLSAALSRFPDLIIFNSEAGLRSHEAAGFHRGRLAVIPNGFDLARFRPDPAAGLAQRAAWGLAADAPLVGIAGRLEPVKDHPMFLKAAARVAAARPEARFVCLGGGSEAYAARLRAEAETLGLGGRILWTGAWRDMPAAYNALTVLALASRDEGFPNVLGEAMACGVPCATTLAGDAARLVGETGVAVPVGDEAALAGAILSLLDGAPETRARRAAACRERIQALFPAEALARRTEAALEALLPAPAAPPTPAGA